MGNTAIKGDKNTSGFTPRNKKGTPKIFKNIGWYFAILIVVLLIIVMAVPSLGIFSGSRQGEEYVFGKFADREIKFASGMEKMGPVLTKLYDTLTGIQMGRIEDKFSWVHKIEL